MTQEEKQLLLQDLCARLPYKIFAQWYHRALKKFRNVKIMKISTYGKNIDDYYINVLCQPEPGADYEASVVEIKPYLRPMSSMTEKEKKELLTLLVGEDSISYFKVENDGITNTCENIQFGHNWQYYWVNFSNENISLYVDWLNAHHFDYRSLIGKGLALEAHEGMYNN